jgi:hypothetical protein
MRASETELDRLMRVAVGLKGRLAKALTIKGRPPIKRDEPRGSGRSGT